MVDHDSKGPSLSPIFDFLLRKVSREFKVCGMSILHEYQMAKFSYCWRLPSHGRAHG